MAKWVPAILRRIRALANAGKVRFTAKALQEIAALGIGLDSDDVCDVLANLSAADSGGRLLSRVTGEWMYVFVPEVAGEDVYLKVILRNDCVVVSFHAQEGVRDEEET